MNAPCQDVRLIVVTDSERILGLGDQGAGGMAIPIGKLALYTVGAGIHPSHTQPICIDVGTDNEELLDDELYIGWRERRLRGPEYDELVEEFVRAVMSLYPKAILQWEDFKKVNAMRLLERYRERLLSFNDDIQGTAAVGLAGVLAGVRATGVPLAHHRVVLLGAGAAGIGIADQVRTALRRTGLTESDVLSRVAMLDSRGLLHEGRTYREGEGYKARYSWSNELVAEYGVGDTDMGLEAVVGAIRPTVLIGTSGQSGIFSEAVIREMASHTERPLIFPFSNPTSKSEAVPEDLIEWTEGRALVATGSPFRPVEYEGRTIQIGQGNNVFIFPGVGLGALVAEARQVTDEMFTVAAETLAEQVTSAELEQGQLYPQLTRLRIVSSAIANAVAQEAMQSGWADSADEVEVATRIEETMWEPISPNLIPA